MPSASIGMVALFAAAAFRDSSTQASATDDPQACTFAAALPSWGAVRYFVRAASKHGQTAEGFAGEVNQLAHVSILPVPAFMLLDKELPAREHGLVGRGHARFATAIFACAKSSSCVAPSSSARTSSTSHQIGCLLESAGCGEISQRTASTGG